MNSDFCDLCRLCATKTTLFNRVHLFHEEGKLKALHFKVTSCLPIEITECDYLPKVICKECIASLDSLYEFRTICVQTDTFLKNLYEDSRPLTDAYDKPDETLVQVQAAFVSESFDKLEVWTTDGQHLEIRDDGKKLTTELVDAACREKSVVCEASLYREHTENSFEQDKEMILESDPSTLIIENDTAVSVLQSNIQHNKNIPIIQQVPSLYRCHYCKIIFPTHKESLDHLKAAHQKIHKCNTCEKSFRSPEDLAVHRERYAQLHKEKEAMLENKKRKLKEIEMQNQCKECGKQYKRSRELRLHERSHSGEKPYSCKYCSKNFAASSSRNKHEQVHEKRWSHVCSYCGKGFVDKIHYTYHVQKQHTGERPYACSQCDKKFVRKQDLKMHRSNFHGNKPRQCFKCDICNNVYTTMSYLKQHKLIHEIPLETRKKFKCNTCDAVFLTNNKLKQHTLTHTGELPFECEICKKRYSSKMGLKIHLLIHSGVKKYVCEVCEKAFALRNSLVCHRRTHTGEKPYQCNICRQLFTQKSSLNTHRKRHTNKEEIPVNSWTA